MMGASDGEPWSSIWDVEKARSIAQEGPDGLYNIPHEGPQHSAVPVKRGLSSCAIAWTIYELTVICPCKP